MTRKGQKVSFYRAISYLDNIKDTTSDTIACANYQKEVE
jgi:hypothetical protein